MADLVTPVPLLRLSDFLGIRHRSGERNHFYTVHSATAPTFRLNHTSHPPLIPATCKLAAFRRLGPLRHHFASTVQHKHLETYSYGWESCSGGPLRYHLGAAVL
jgi:hypothetical protein